MGRTYIKLCDGEKPWYLLWSTVVDAPVTWGMTKDELFDHVATHNRGSLPPWWPAAWARLQEHGAAAHGAGTALDVIVANRAGAGETCLTYEELIEFYCRRKGSGNPIKGKHTHSGVGAVDHCRGVDEPSNVMSPGELASYASARDRKRG